MVAIKTNYALIVVVDGGWQSSGTDPVACNVNQITEPVFHTERDKILLLPHSPASYKPNCAHKKPVSKNLFRYWSSTWNIIHGQQKCMLPCMLPLTKNYLLLGSRPTSDVPITSQLSPITDKVTLFIYKDNGFLTKGFDCMSVETDTSLKMLSY